MLQEILIQSPTKAAPSFEERVLKHLGDLTNAQKSFEARIEKRLDNFEKSHQSQSSVQCPNRLHQNQEPIRSTYDANQRRNMEQPRHIRGEYHMPPVPTVHDDTHYFEDFEELDQNFPITKPENVEDLEYNTRKDLDFKLLLVI